eukprot:2385501-Prymnesium_polylepis.2
MHTALQQQPKAYADCTAAFALVPESPVVYTCLAETGAALSVVEKEALYRRALALTPSGAVAYQSLGTMLRGRGRFAEVCEWSHPNRRAPHRARPPRPPPRAPTARAHRARPLESLPSFPLRRPPPYPLPLPSTDPA